MKTLKHTLRTCLLLLLALVLIVHVWLLAERLILKQDLPKFFGYSQAVATSDSMEPLFSNGDLLIFSEKIGYKPGDVVIFRQGESMATRRIVSWKQGGFVTKGDASNIDDTDILDPGTIQGELVGIVPGIGTVINFLYEPMGLYLLILLGVVLFMLPRLKRLEKQKKQRNYQHAETSEQG